MKKYSRFTEKTKRLAQNPQVNHAIKSIKPEKSIWGFLGVFVFFILPEIIAYGWGEQITHYATTHLPLATSYIEEKYFDLLIILFEEGISWFNLAMGIFFLIWLFL